MKFTAEHRALADTVTRFVEKELNPFVPQWEADEIYPAHEVFKKLGQLGLLGLKYPEEYGGAGLDFSYSLTMAEALGNCACGGVPMSIGVQTDMCTPALARFGSDELRREFLAPANADALAAMGDQLRQRIDRESNVLFGTARLWDDGIVDPRDTRRVLALALALAREADARTLRGNTFGVARF